MTQRPLLKRLDTVYQSSPTEMYLQRTPTTPIRRIYVDNVPRRCSYLSGSFINSYRIEAGGSIVV